MVVKKYYRRWLYIYWKNRVEESIYRDSWRKLIRILITIVIKVSQRLLLTLHKKSGSHDDWSSYPHRDAATLTLWDLRQIARFMKAFTLAGRSVRESMLIAESYNP